MTTLNQDILISLTDVEKTFAKTIHSNQRRLARAVLHDLFPIRSAPAELRENEFKSLADINLTIRRGEAVGLVGHNGAGKTTLLRILANQLSADSGIVDVKGDVSELINLTAGYQKTLSGRENIYIGGALRGKSRAFIKEHFEEILEFSELHDFIDAPFGTYSLGMKMRLGFSVAVHTEPDILLIDEVLGVGDLRFRNKCLGRLQAMKAATAFILVTHSMSQIRDFCDRAILLNSGRVLFDGAADKGAALYEKRMTDTPPADETSAPVTSTGPTLANVDMVQIHSTNWAVTGTSVKPEFEFSADLSLLRPVTLPKLGILIYDQKGNEIVSLSDPNNVDIKQLEQARSSIKVSMLGLRLNPGTYSTVLTVLDGPELLFRDKVQDLVIESSGGRPWGLLRTASRWTVGKAPTS